MSRRSSLIERGGSIAVADFFTSRFSVFRSDLYSLSLARRVAFSFGSKVRASRSILRIWGSDRAVWGPTYNTQLRNSQWISTPDLSPGMPKFYEWETIYLQNIWLWKNQQKLNTLQWVMWYHCTRDSASSIPVLSSASFCCFSSSGPKTAHMWEALIPTSTLSRTHS